MPRRRAKSAGFISSERRVAPHESVKRGDVAVSHRSMIRGDRTPGHWIITANAILRSRMRAPLYSENASEDSLSFLENSDARSHSSNNWSGLVTASRSSFSSSTARMMMPN